MQNVMGILFSATQFLGMTNMMAIMPILGYERVVFYRCEAAAGRGVGGGSGGRRSGLAP